MSINDIRQWTARDAVLNVEASLGWLEFADGRRDPFNDGLNQIVPMTDRRQEKEAA